MRASRGADQRTKRTGGAEEGVGQHVVLGECFQGREGGGEVGELAKALLGLGMKWIGDTVVCSRSESRRVYERVESRLRGGSEG